MLILDVWGINFHAVIVFGLGKNLLFKYVLGHCALQPLAIIYTPEFNDDVFRLGFAIKIEIEKLSWGHLRCTLTFAKTQKF